MNKYIVAIGGGDTLEIDQRIVKLSSKKSPQVLFIPTASYDDQRYIDWMEKLYGQKLKCKFETLLLLREKPSKKEIKEKIAAADIIYVGGGNTLKMVRLWRRLGVDKLLKNAYNKGAVLCGVSAGAICWFDYGHSDSMSYYNPKKWEYIRVKGLGFLSGTACPHYDSKTGRKYRRKDFQKMFLKNAGTGPGSNLGLAITDSAALLYNNGNIQEVLTTTKTASASQLTKIKGKVQENPL